MWNQSSSRPAFFANTGVQIACYPLRGDLQLPAEQIGSGWQHCLCKVQNEVVSFGYLQWQVLRQKLFLAIDTTVGVDDADVGCCVKASAPGGEFASTITGLLGLDRAPLPGIPPLEFAIRLATAEGGEPRDVHLVIDFGNSRTSALLVEFRGSTAQEPLMTPLQLANRYRLDASNASRTMVSGQGGWSFSSRSHWCTPPYLPALRREKTVSVYGAEPRRRMFGSPVKQVPVTVFEPEGGLLLGEFTSSGERDAGAEVNQTRAAVMPRLDEDVQFTAFRPKTVTPDRWHDLFVAAHLAEKRPDAPDDELEPIEKVRRCVEKLIGDQESRYKEVTQDSRHAIPQAGGMTFVPEMEKVEFNPCRYSFLWKEDQHVASFRMRASADIDGQMARGRISVFLGALLVADIPLQIQVDSGCASAVKREWPEKVSARPYRKIFASYSHKDLAIVEQCERYVTMIGDRYLRDWKDLRAGEEWNARLSEMIKEADVFQLFWSQHAMESKFVRQEWEYALGLGRQNFVRPVYWETPFPERPGLPPGQLRGIHFQRLSMDTPQPSQALPDLPAPEPKETVTPESRVLGPTRGEPMPVTVSGKPRPFEDFSMVRLGHEADDLAGQICVEGECRTGVSSPKRYLWARDDSWLEGANWYMADPFHRYDAQHGATLLKGPFLRFVREDDACDEPKPEHEEFPPKPRHAPRVLMVAALYELLGQAYTYMNSPLYRHLTGDAGRMRLLRSVTLTYPSGMIPAERVQLQNQAHKAISIFKQTLGKNQLEPELKLSVDEASAVHLTYIWSEVQKLGRQPRLWFSVVGRRSPEEAAEPAPEAAREEGPRRPATSARRGRRRTHPADSGRRTDRAVQGVPEIRIACIDIGGGNTNLMIARYTCRTGTGGDLIEGETLHRDGISLAGDHLVKRLLERIIVPQFVDVVNLDVSEANMLFGREVPANRAFGAQRVQWINRVFVPVAQAYLENAAGELEEKISHTDPAVVGPEAVQSLQDTIDRIWPKKYDVKQDLGLYYDRGEFDDVVDEVFADLLFDLCESVVAHKADVVLLAGFPSKLRSIQQLVQTFLPLAPSRIIPMYGRYAGSWYPYQNPDNLNPGVIVDPKSTVVVGAAVEFLARHGMLSPFRIRMRDQAVRNSYYWGVMSQSRIDAKSVIFEPRPVDGSASTVQREQLRVAVSHLVIGRKRRQHAGSPASPAYVLKVMRGNRLGEINVNVCLERRLGLDGEEELSLESVEGEVDGQPAMLGVNVLLEWRTLADDRYYLDAGGLDQLELD
ncbi:virulence factor SrfB [Planctomycetota bacterium]